MPINKPNDIVHPANASHIDENFDAVFTRAQTKAEVDARFREITKNAKISLQLGQKDYLTPDEIDSRIASNLGGFRVSSIFADEVEIAASQYVGLTEAGDKWNEFDWILLGVSMVEAGGSRYRDFLPWSWIRADSIRSLSPTIAGAGIGNSQVSGGSHVLSSDTQTSLYLARTADNTLLVTADALIGVTLKIVVLGVKDEQASAFNSIQPIATGEVIVGTADTFPTEANSLEATIEGAANVWYLLGLDGQYHVLNGADLTALDNGAYAAAITDATSHDIGDFAIGTTSTGKLLITNSTTGTYEVSLFQINPVDETYRGSGKATLRYDVYGDATVEGGFDFYSTGGTDRITSASDLGTLVKIKLNESDAGGNDHSTYLEGLVTGDRIETSFGGGAVALTLTKAAAAADGIVTLDGQVDLSVPPITFPTTDAEYEVQFGIYKATQSDGVVNSLETEIDYYGDLQITLGRSIGDDLVTKITLPGAEGNAAVVIPPIETDPSLIGIGDPLAPLQVANPFTEADEAKLDGIESGAQKNVGEEFTTAFKTKLDGIEASAQANVGVEFTTADHTKLDGIAAGAQANVGEEFTAEFKTKLEGIEANAQANVGQTYTTAEKTKLGGIETGAEVNVGQEYTAAEQTKLDGIEAGAQKNVGSTFTATEKTKLSGIATGAEVNVGVEFTTDDHDKLDGIESGAEVNVGEKFTEALKTKLTGIETSATADQTAAEMVTALESLSDDARLDASAIKGIEQTFTSEDETKLDGIETNATADQTASEIRDSLAGLSDDDRLDVSSIKGTNAFTATDEAKLDGIAAGAQRNVGEEFTTAFKTKLEGVETAATADQTGAEMVTALEALSGDDRLDHTAVKGITPFTTEDETKLDGIETSATADQTAAELVTALQSLSGDDRLDASAVKGTGTGDEFVTTSVWTGEAAGESLNGVTIDNASGALDLIFGCYINNTLAFTAEEPRYDYTAGDMFYLYVPWALLTSETQFFVVQIDPNCAVGVKKLANNNVNFALKAGSIGPVVREVWLRRFVPSAD